MDHNNEYTVFYADDDPEDLDFFCEVTDSLAKDVSVVTHENGEKLLAALDNPPPQPVVVFLDLNMPGFNGFEVLKRVRSNEAFSNLPVVIFSTSSDEASIERSRELGANFYVTKSSHFPTLKKSIEHTLNIDWSSFKPNPENFVYAA
ncbi:response regulator [Flavobacterium silvaticum]|uniref:Response regulator n=1 Tax=Flavobacterium silvaticum TaxID=1852020 RepID=A0A972FJM1_9FLAO|nr:response regulator [Flavobacterium silvaticum]NMH26988.1 response regulator [Flavobacterium silvaticum]